MMKKIRAIVCAIAIVAGLGACTPAEWAQAKTVTDDVVSDAEIACQAAIAMGVDNDTLGTVCKDVVVYAPLVNAIFDARKDPTAAQAVVQARLETLKGK